MESNKYKLSDSLSSLPGIGPKIEKLFEGIDVKNIQDLLFYFPRYYKDYRNTKKISEIFENEEVTIKGEIISSNLIRSRTKIYEVVIKDDLAQLKIIWFNPFYRYLKDNFVIGNFAIISGKAVKSRSSKYLQIVNPKPENIIIIGKDEKLEKFGKISPIYPLTKGLTQNRIVNILDCSLLNTELLSLDFFQKI